MSYTLQMRAKRREWKIIFLALTVIAGAYFYFCVLGDAASKSSSISMVNAYAPDRVEFIGDLLLVGNRNRDVFSVRGGKLSPYAGDAPREYARFTACKVAPAPMHRAFAVECWDKSEVIQTDWEPGFDAREIHTGIFNERYAILLKDIGFGIQIFPKIHVLRKDDSGAWKYLGKLDVPLFSTGCGFVGMALSGNRYALAGCSTVYLHTLK